MLSFAAKRALYFSSLFLFTCEISLSRTLFLYLLAVHPGVGRGHRVFEPETKEREKKYNREIYSWRLYRNDEEYYNDHWGRTYNAFTRGI